MRKGLMSLVAGFMCLSLIGCGKGHDKANSIQIKGSDTMVNLVQAWTEAFMEANLGSYIAVTGGGSGTGIAALLNGTCDIAMCSRKMKGKEIELARENGIEPKEMTVALDGLAVVVHPSNPIEGLTISQLSDIFTGKVTNWKDVGGKEGKILVASREVNSGTHVYFKEHVLAKKEYGAEALLMPSSQAVADEVAQNQNAIGYYGMGYISPNQKAIKVAKDENSLFVAPILDNVTNGDYHISRPLLIYTNGEPTGLVKKFLDFVLSAEGQEIVKKIDFVPVI
ncbi:MAG: phosphate ABC transporter substrate-binding protein [bacterium]|nr:phosphate ABC transporter substrate-binding protein [bacterium]